MRSTEKRHATREHVPPAIERVADYPRPPAVEPVEARLTVRFAGTEVASTRRGLRVLETHHPPTYYFPPGDVREDLLHPAPGSSHCEWKGIAVYRSLVVGSDTAYRAVWSYPKPRPGYEALQGHLAFYPGRMERCTVGGEVVEAQEGDFYGGWITARVQGPFKGGPGTGGW